MEAHIRLKNAEEFQQLTRRAATLAKQLDETLQQISDFKPELEMKAGSSEIHVDGNTLAASANNHLSDKQKQHDAKRIWNETAEKLNF